LVQINGRRLKAGIAAHSRQQVYSMLLWTARERGYKPGFASAKFKARFGDWPHGLSAVAAEPDPPFLGWMRSEQIRWHKGLKKREASHAG